MPGRSPQGGLYNIILEYIVNKAVVNKLNTTTPIIARDAGYHDSMDITMGQYGGIVYCRSRGCYVI